MNSQNSSDVCGTPPSTLQEIQIVIPAWLKGRTNLSKSFKDFYGTVAAIINNRGETLILRETLAQACQCSVETIGRHIKTARQQQLISISKVNGKRERLFRLL